MSGLVKDRDSGHRTLTARRSAATLVAMLLGVGMLVVAAGYMEGTYSGMIEDNVRVQTSHLQVRVEGHERSEGSLKWEDLLDDADERAAQVRALPEVRDATPILWASGVIGIGRAVGERGREWDGLRVRGQLPVQ